MTLINQNSIIGVTSITSTASSDVITFHTSDTTERLRIDTSGNATFSGNVTIGGTLTYEDVTNIDSIGIITARSEVIVGAGLSVVGVSTLGNTVVGGATTELVVGGDARITGILTVGSSSITIDGTTNTVSTTNLTVNGNAYPSAGPLSNRNKIINGDMRIDQRNAGVSVNVTSNVYTLDRWNCGGVNDGVLAMQRVSDGPSGFTNSLKVTVSTADSSLGTTQYARVGQKIEGFNVADFAGGTASAATVVLSFWIKSSVTGTYGGHIANGDESRVYVFQYTVNSANTWEYKSVAVTLSTSGTWATDNTAGMRIFFSLGCGSSYINTANTWLTSYAQQASGNVNLIETSSATWQLTGVQLEVGTVATPFERRSYGQELALCQRYCFVINGSSSFNGNGYARYFLHGSSSSGGLSYITFPVQMRTTPTLLTKNFVSGNVDIFNYSTASGATFVSVASAEHDVWHAQLTFTLSGTLASGHIMSWRWSNVPDAYIGFSAEL